MILNVFPRKMVRVLLFSSCIKSYIFQAQLMFFFFFFFWHFKLFSYFLIRNKQDSILL